MTSSSGTAWSPAAVPLPSTRLQNAKINGSGGADPISATTAVYASMMMASSALSITKKLTSM